MTMTCVSFIEEDFRRTLMRIEQENVSLKNEVNILKAENTRHERKISALEGHICETQTQNDNLQRKLNSANETVRNLQQEVGPISIGTVRAYMHACICLNTTLI